VIDYQNNQQFVKASEQAFQLEEEEETQNIPINNSLNTIEYAIMNSINFDQPKTASIETDYANLFRGLSSYVPSISITEGLKDLNQEKTYHDLTDALISDQARNQAMQMNANNVANSERMLSQLTTLDNTAIKIIPDSIKQEANLAQMIISEEIDTDSSTNSNNSTNSSTASYGSVDNLSPVTRGRPQKIKPIKRLSTASTTSNSSSNFTTDIPRITTNTRGRKPSGMAPASVPVKANGKKTKKQLMLEEAEKNKKPVVCFGNKVVPKETDEYYKRRENNNEAVKKCREKLSKKQQEREERMKTLDEENKRLTSTVESLNKELNVLKNIIIQMNPQQKLPEYITNLFKQLEEDS